MRRSWTFVIMMIAGCALLGSLARAQERLRKQIVFSGVVTEAKCRELPLPSFTISPSGDRWKTGDLLTVRCVSRNDGLFGELSLTFTIDVNAPSPLGIEGKIFSFRWGKTVYARSAPFVGQFTNLPALCEKLAALFNSNALKPSLPEGTLGLPKLASSCNADDQWGTSMEIEMTGDLSDSH